MEFQIGDRVTATEDVSCFEVKGRSGVIKDFEAYEHGCTVEFDDNMGGHTGNGNCKTNHGLYVNFNILKLVDLNQTVTIHSNNNITTATLKNGNTAIKTAIATCNPLDKFSFTVGARVAFDRLMGEEVVKVGKLEVKEVEREARIGEWIRIIRNPFTTVKFEEILEVKSKYYSRVGVVGSRKSSLDDETWCLDVNSYVVLENYIPSVYSIPAPTTIDLSKVPGAELFAEIQRRVNL